MDGNYKINNIPRGKIRDYNNADSNTDNNDADIDNTANDSGENSQKDDSLENLDPSLRNSIDDITAILNAKIRNSDISTKHKESIETQIEVLANLIKSYRPRLTILLPKMVLFFLTLMNKKPSLLLIRTPK